MAITINFDAKSEILFTEFLTKFFEQNPVLWESVLSDKINKLLSPEKLEAIINERVDKIVHLPKYDTLRVPTSTAVKDATSDDINIICKNPQISDMFRHFISDVRARKCTFENSGYIQSIFHIIRSFNIDVQTDYNQPEENKSCQTNKI